MSCSEIFFRELGLNSDLTLKSLTEILWRSLKQRCLQEPCQETSSRDLVPRSCQDTSYGDLVYRDIAKRSIAEILPRGLLHFLESLCRDLIKRPCREILSRGLAKRPLIEICTEILPRGLLQRSCQQSSYIDLVQRSCQERSYRDLVPRPGAKSGGLARRSFIDSLNRDLTLRSLTKIFCGDFL